MRVESLYLRDFRNYSEASISFAEGINLICGSNAQGKTNMLEAVYMLTGGRSFRTRFDREMIGFDALSAEIKAEIFASERKQKLEISLKRGLKKEIRLNGVKKSSGELGETLKAVLFCPDDLNLIKDGAAARRRLMDMAICQLRPGYSKLLSDFNKLYENKSRILRDFKENPSMLDTLDDFSRSLALVSARMIRYRASFARRLAETAFPIHSEFSGRGEELEIKYSTVSTVKDPTASVEQIFGEIMEHQQSHRSAELSSGSCLTGAHKDELEISINGRAARSFASQGQTRTAALSIKMAEREIILAETGEPPVLLLDDVLSELDARRQEFVLNRIGGGQTLITCCEDEDISQRTGGRVIMVENGRVI
ncbi:MAG: DNA replication/repair protein RecF [Ruminococcaceae bacterium]|nr:DNA replication/repair protein RecF [Oscillospiraceae bacterium]